jgi:hypothetical protein
LGATGEEDEMRHVKVAFAAACMLTLAGCGRHGAPGNRSSIFGAGPHGVVTGGEDESAGAKLDGYIKGYNTLIGTFGLAEQYQQYTGQHIAQKGVNDSVFVLPGWIGNSIDDLKKARAIPGGPEDLDQAGDRLIPVVDRLTSELKGLESYYQSRGQLADNFARGKREDPQVIADFKAAMAATDQLSAAIDKEQAKRDQVGLDAFKASGDMIGYDGALAIQRSKALVDLFHGAGDARDHTKLAKADALVATITQTLADERQRLDKSKGVADAQHGVRNSMNGSAADQLDTMIGAYRDFRRSGDATYHQAMISAYNDAVEQANMGHIGG